ncbi:MAG: hypothetical protein Q8L68_01435 [Methylococcales bacterium]|nr:hypothetical protein [Methylococcales bacterium]
MPEIQYADTETTKILIEIANLLKKYQAYETNGPLRLRRIGKDHDGGYVVAELALEQADIIMGFGIYDDSSFEEQASMIYGKRSYGFDGSVLLQQPAHKLFHFSPLFLISHEETKKIQGRYSNAASFDDMIQIFHLEEKKLFIKMDIERSEYTTMPDVLRHASKITGITFELHFGDDEDIPLALDLLKQIQKDFFLIHVHGQNPCNRFSVSNVKGEIPRFLELSYINKHLVKSAELAVNQRHPTPLDMPNNPKYPDIYFEIL